jgi:flagellar protein FliO/FliZ
MSALRRLPLLLAAAWAAPVAAQGTLAPGADSGFALIGRLLLILAAILALGWMARAFGRRRLSSGSGLQIEGGLALGTRERLVVVRVQGEHLLLGVTAGGISLLHRLDGPLQGPHPQPPPGEGAAFAERLREIMKRSLGQ